MIYGKVLIGEKVEGIIRKYCALLPDNEWSGIVLYRESGSFEDKSIVIECVDFLLMDIGTSVHTSFEFGNFDIASFIAERPELYDCRIGILHSHNKLQAFLSGEDMATLKGDANDTTNALSIVVNNAGEYVAAITRRFNSAYNVHIKETIQCDTAYKFFDKEYPVEEKSYTKTEEKDDSYQKSHVEICSLEVERPEICAPELDERFGQVLQKKARLTVYEEKEGLIQPRIFDRFNEEEEEEDDLEALCTKVKWDESNFTKFKAQLLYMSPFAGVAPQLLDEVVELYRRRFDDVQEFKDFFGSYMEILLDTWEFKFTGVPDDDFEFSYESVALRKMYNALESENCKSEYVEAILDVLDEYSIHYR